MREMKFTLQIELGNDAMQTYTDIRKAIQHALTGERIYMDAQDELPHSSDGGEIMDVNGNGVGHWTVR